MRNLRTTTETEKSNDHLQMNQDLKKRIAEKHRLGVKFKSGSATLLGTKQKKKDNKKKKMSITEQ